MDIFLELENRVRSLVEALRDANAELASVRERCSRLETENLAARRALAVSEQRRREAVDRIDTLLGKITDRIGAEKV